MGTNFYLIDNLKQLQENDHMDPSYHIGKRSAAGYYCWDCKTTLCKGGESQVHHGCNHHDIFCNCMWYDKCPKCGKEPIKENFENSTGGRELGFNKNTPQKKSSVSSCCSFSWAMNMFKCHSKYEIINDCINFSLDTKNKKIFDEYDKEYSLKEFIEVLEECPIQYFNSIGSRFF